MRLRSIPSFWLLMVLAGLGTMPFILGAGWVSVLTEILILAIAACGLNLMLGYAGMVNFGPAGVYGVGAYTTALLIMKADAPFGLALIAGPLMAGIIGAIVGWFCVRLTHVYFSLLTLAFSQIIHTIIFEWYGFTGGDNGIVDIPVPTLLKSPSQYYYFTLVLLVLCIWIMRVIVHSPFGKTLQALRENPERTEFIGIPTRKFRLRIFVLSSFFLGAAGSLFCGFNHNVFPDYAHWMKGSEILIVCLLGGMYNFYGPVVGSAVFILLEKIIMSYTQYSLLVMGLVIILLVLFLGEGVVGFISEKLFPARAKNDSPR